MYMLALLHVFSVCTFLASCYIRTCFLYLLFVFLMTLTQSSLCSCKLLKFTVFFFDFFPEIDQAQFHLLQLFGHFICILECIPCSFLQNFKFH